MSQPESEHRTLSVLETDDKAANSQAASSNDTRMTQNQEPVPEFIDSSGPLFSMYCSIEKDYRSAEFLKTGADTLIVFLGLFSATVATILAVTFQDLSPNPQDRSAFYLENIYKLQLLEDSNTSRPSVPAQPPPFSPPKYAIWVNTLLSLSLCLNLFIAIVAIAEWRWMSLGILIAESPQDDPHHRARVQDVVANDYKAWRAPITWFLTIMVYFSAWCFFLGLAIYGFNISRGVFAFAFPVSWLCAFAFCIFEYCLSAVHRSQSQTKIDDRVLGQLFKTLVKDSDFIKFFENIPGFCRSSVVRDPRLLKHTWSSALPNSEKMRRLVICVNVADSVRLRNVASSILEEIFPRDCHDVLQSVDMGHSLRNQSNGTQQEIGLCAQSIIAGIISNVQESNDTWVALAADQLGKSEGVIRGYLKRGMTT
ncbi:hypothetical protein BGW80DRAFT_1460688 [Lactifluus volemus]|nr:hypothetical protein BGW80DRAFT_1460688 [Lactifluus volemus]